MIRACGYTTPSFPIPGIGLGGLAPSPYPFPGTGLNSSPIPVLSGLPLTKDDFRTHRAPILLIYTTGPTTRPFAATTKEPCLSYRIDDQREAPPFNCAGRTRSRTTILAGNTPLRPDYRAAARSGFAASVASAAPPKFSFHSSPPRRSDRLGPTIPLARPASPRLMPAPNPQLDYSSPAAPSALQSTAPDNGTSATAEHLSNILLSYSHRDWDQAQRADPLCDATRRFIQLGCPNRPLYRFALTCLHTRSLKPDISPTSPQKVTYYREMMTPSYSSGNLSSSPWRLMATTAAGADPPSITPSVFMCRSWPDRGSCTHATPTPLVPSMPHVHSKCWNASIGG